MRWEYTLSIQSTGRKLVDDPIMLGLSRSKRPLEIRDQALLIMSALNAWADPDHPNQNSAMNIEDRRKHPRKKVDRPLKIDDFDRGSPLGLLVDISLEGLMLLSPEPIEVNRVFHVSLELPEEIGGGQAALFGAESLWGEASNDPGKFWVGFQIIDISPENIGKIHRLIDECL